MTIELSKGGNMALVLSDGRQPGVCVIGVNWPNISADVDLVALLCGADRKVRSNSDFLYWDARVSPAEDVLLRIVPPGQKSRAPDRAQLIVDLTRIEPDVERIFMALALLDGSPLAVAGQIGLQLFDAPSGAVLITYFSEDAHQQVNTIIMAELYRFRGQWKVRIVDQGYAEGLAVLGRDFGVDISG